MAAFVGYELMAPKPAGKRIMIDKGFRQRVREALQRVNTDGMNKDILFAVFDLETGGGYSEKGNETFAHTNSLSNRHRGTGRGEWTGKIYYAGPGDPDLRVYTDMDQSIRDFVQLMHDPLYAQAYAAAVAGDYKAYFRAMAKAGYSTQGDYELALNNRYKQVVG